MHAAILRAVVFFLFSSAVWGLLPLLVRQELRLGPQAFGVLLGCMGAGAVGAGFLLPALRGRLDRGQTVLAGSLLGAAAMAVLGLIHHWAAAAIAMLLYGVAWIAAASTLQAAAQMAAPAWVRARAMGIYQMSFFGAMALGAALAGVLAARLGVPMTLCLFAAAALAAALLVRNWTLDGQARTAGPVLPPVRPEPAAAELGDLLREDGHRVLEAVRYHIRPEDRGRFLAVMEEVRRVRLRGGAMSWRLYEDVAHPERWVELWAIESWEEHLREAGRLTEDDLASLSRARAFHAGEAPPEAARYVNVPV
jgi:MFS family permease